MKVSNYLKSLTPTFLFVDFWKGIACFNDVIFNNTQKSRTCHNINVKVKFKTYFQLKFISTMYLHGYITRPWRYNTD